MRNTLTMLSRAPSDHAHVSVTATPPPVIPTIRLVAATPSEANTTSVRNCTVTPWDTSLSAGPSPIAPKQIGTADVAPRKRLIPKKSKLSLLGSKDRSKDVSRGKDLSDVVRRVGASDSANMNGGFEIYVDPTDDPDIGEILMVKKKKSRAGLDGLRWGALGEVTNVPSTKPEKSKSQKKEKDGFLKVKSDDKEKWWSIGRGRKDSKEQARDLVKSPDPTSKPLPPIDSSRTRFNSLDSGIVLNSPMSAIHLEPGNPSATDTESKDRVHETFANAEFLAPPGAPANGKGSVAIRAIRSVRSLARIGSWAQLKTMGNGEDGEVAVRSKSKDIKEKEKEKEKGSTKKKKKKKEKEKEKERENNATVRYSGSSFEAGALSASPGALSSKTLGRKKASVLGLGLGFPSTIKLPTMRNGSSASDVSNAPTNLNRLSVDSVPGMNSGGIVMKPRSGSTMSSSSSLRPMSMASGVSSNSAGVSVRWDEAGLETVKERTKMEKQRRRQREREDSESSSQENGKKTKAKDKSTRRTSDGRRRTPISSIFPETQGAAGTEDTQYDTPLVTVEEATVDGHEPADDPQVVPDNMQTPVKRSRPRPMSEQLLGRARPKGIYEDENDNGVISMLDAATNDLAQLINRLDLEATPGTADSTPLKRSPFADGNDISPTKLRLIRDSPLKSNLRRSLTSISSLRPYAQSQDEVASYLGKNIASWTALSASISPAKAADTFKCASSNKREDVFAMRLQYERELSPAPASEASPVIKPLRPAKLNYRTAALKATRSSLESPARVSYPDYTGSPSSKTFGSRHSKTDSQSSHADIGHRQAHGHSRKPSSLAHIELSQRKASSEDGSGSPSLPLAPEARRNLGLAGTMGGSIGSNASVELDTSDPDSDIPDELQVLLSSQSDGTSVHDVDDTLSFPVDVANEVPLPFPGPPSEVPLPSQRSLPSALSVPAVPVFRACLIDDEDNHADIEEAGTSSDEDTKKSFDFTGELKKLNESGGSDRHSFVEELENAFRSPPKLDLRYDFGLEFNNGFLGVSAPDIPQKRSLFDELSKAGDSTFFNDIQDFPVDVNAEPSLLPGTDSFASNEDVEDEAMGELPQRPVCSARSMRLRASDGQLNLDFKFGGRPSPQKAALHSDQPLTLSDVIPPLSHVRSLYSQSASEEYNTEDDAVLKSILAKAIEETSPRPRARLDSDSSSKQRIRLVSANEVEAGHVRNSSEFSFAGFDSFAEVRRGFEFKAERPTFYPPSVLAPPQHGRHESVFSIASVSSYGHVINSGSDDPFDYGKPPSMHQRNLSDDLSLSMSMSVDDTFSFIRKQPRRGRVDSDASSYYFRASAQNQAHPYNREHRRHESSISVASNAPPVSLYNRSFGKHRRMDSNTSTSSVAQSYALFGANGGRAAWARHRQDYSVDSLASDFSGVYLGRPGLGDKMLESGLDHGVPLTAISASPPESLAGSPREQVTAPTYVDSITDEDDLKSSSGEDSLFEKTGYRTSVSSESVFGGEDPMPLNRHLLPPHQFRPVSSFSMVSIHSPAKEDDTMISMLGGGHVRRRSVGSMIQASPCVRVEKRKLSSVDVPQLDIQDDSSTGVDEAYISPNKARIIEKPSIASAVSSRFGDERMIRAKRGLLERQSLEDTCIVGDGEDPSLSLRLQQPVFTRPGPVTTRSRSSTCTSSSGADTPPLSISDGYTSVSESSQSSLDLSHVNFILSNATHPISNTTTLGRVRPRARGQGHRRRISEARASRASMYETIEEEMMSAEGGSPKSAAANSVPGSVTKTLGKPGFGSNRSETAAVFVVDPETASIDSVHSFSGWDDEHGIIALRRYYALKAEAHDTVVESKRAWLDTPFSIFAVQSFDPPRHPQGMQALLEHSIQNYGPLPSELRRMRTRTLSRPSPYPTRSRKTSTSAHGMVSMSPTSPRIDTVDDQVDSTVTLPDKSLRRPGALQQVPLNPNLIPSPTTTTGNPGKVFSLLQVSETVFGQPQKVFGLPPAQTPAAALGARQRVTSSTRRNALGWAKRSTGKNDNKENASVSMDLIPGAIISPPGTLRLNRPRPRGRPTPVSTKPIHVR